MLMMMMMIRKIHLGYVSVVDNGIRETTWKN